MIDIKRYWQHVTFGNVLCLLLFLYPLFATVVRHWNSTLFLLIMLLGLVYYFSQKRKDKIALHEYEKIFLWLLAGNFLVFLITSLINLPDDIRNIRLDIEARFLLIIPLYFLLRNTGNAFDNLSFGAFLSVFVVLGYSVYAIEYKNEHSFDGIYSHLYTAPVTLMYAVIGGYYIFADFNKFKTGTRWVLAAFLVVAALYTIYQTQSRVTYFGVLVTGILLAILFAKKWWKLVSIVAMVIVIFVASINLENIRARMTVAYSELTDYLSLDDPDKRVSTTIGTSVGTRLEMWRIAPLVLRDHTFLGVGNGNYEKALKIYVDEKKLNQVVILNSHAHNVFVNVLIVKGLLGLVITCLVLFYPLYVYIKTFRQSQSTASLGIIFVSLIFVISMNETAPFVKSNFVATYLLLSLVIFQNHMKHIRSEHYG